MQDHRLFGAPANTVERALSVEINRLLHPLLESRKWLICYARLLIVLVGGPCDTVAENLVNWVS